MSPRQIARYALVVPLLALAINAQNDFLGQKTIKGVGTECTDRQFRVVADPESGLRSATHFVGYIPVAKAPDHFHSYDEVIYVLEGEGMMHMNGESTELSPGSCIHLPNRTVHCLENVGDELMRVVAVFRPAGSPNARPSFERCKRKTSS